MKIAVYHPWVYLKGGIERTMLELISRSRHDWTVFTSHYAPENTFPEFRNFRVVPLKPVAVKRNMAAVLQSAWQIFSQKIPLAGYDAFVVWCDGLGDLITFRNRSRPTFCICSTPLRPVYDPVYAARALQERKLLGRLAFHAFKTLFGWVDRWAWSHYDGVISTSTEVSERILRNHLHQGGDRFRLHYPGIDASKAPSQVTYEPFLLVPGRIMWTKNIELAIDAFLKGNLPEPWKLVIAGFVDEKSKAYVEALRKKVGYTPRIELVESPSDRELISLYERASVMLFPPENEDWGIVPLEAMLRRKPVIANNRGGPAESVVSGRTGWLLEPTVDAWAKVLAELPQQSDLIREMGAQAGEHVRRFDWSQFVNGVDDAIEAWCEEMTTEKKMRLLPQSVEEGA